MKFRVGGIVNYFLYPFFCVFFFPIGTWTIYDIIFGPDYNNWGKFFLVLVILSGLFALSLKWPPCQDTNLKNEVTLDIDAGNFRSRSGA